MTTAPVMAVTMTTAPVLAVTMPTVDNERRKVSGDLAAVSDGVLDLTPVGGAFDVDLLYIVQRPLADLTAPQRAALDAAAEALGFAPVQTAFLSIDDVTALLAAHPACPLDARAAADAYVEALDPHTVLCLDARTLTTWPVPEKLERHPDGHHGLTATVAGRPFAAVTDFFAALDSEPDKADAWAQMRVVRRVPFSS